MTDAPDKPEGILRREAERLEGGKRQAVLASKPRQPQPRPEGADKPLSPSPSPPSPQAPVVPTSDELVASVARAQQALREAAEKGGMRHDPVRYMLAAISDVLGVQIKTTRRWEGCVADVIAAREPFPVEQRVALVEGVIAASKAGALEGGQTGMREEARRIIRRFDRGTAIRAGLAVGGAYAAGGLTVAALALLWQLGPFSQQAASIEAWRAVVETNPDPRSALAAAEVRVDRATGRRYYAGMSLWLDPPRPPPASAAK